MHGRVLAHLELGEVEAERLDLPEQLLQVPVGLARRAAPARASPARRAGRRAAARGRGRRGRHRARASRRSCARAAARCGGAARSGERFAISVAASSSAALSRCQQREQRVARRGGRGIQRQPAPDAVRGALEAEEHVLARDRGGLAGDGCRHERVAVAVAADPRPDAHERAHDGRARRLPRDPAGRRRRGGTRAGSRCRASRRTPPSRRAPRRWATASRVAAARCARACRSPRACAARRGARRRRCAATRRALRGAPRGAGCSSRPRAAGPRWGAR